MSRHKIRILYYNNLIIINKNATIEITIQFLWLWKKIWQPVNGYCYCYCYYYLGLILMHAMILFRSDFQITIRFATNAMWKWKSLFLIVYGNIFYHFFLFFPLFFSLFPSLFLSVCVSFFLSLFLSLSFAVIVLYIACI